MIWRQWLEVPAADPDDARRRRLLNALLAGVAALSLLVALATTGAWLAGLERERALTLYAGSAAMLVSVGAVYAINRYGPGWLASSLFLLLFTVISALADEPQQVVDGRTLFVFAIPVFMASVLLRPWASFVAAGFVGLLPSVLGHCTLYLASRTSAVWSSPWSCGPGTQGTVPEDQGLGFIALNAGLIPNLIAILAFFAVALVSWLSARSLERALREANCLRAFNEGIVQSMAEGVLVEDAGGYFTFANPAAAAMLDWQVEELVGQHWTAVVPPDQHAAVYAASERRILGGADRYELELVRKDGTRVPVLISGSPRFEGGRFAGTLAAITDVTELKRSEERFRQLAENIREIFWLLDLDEGRMVYVSPAYEEVYGRSPERLFEDPSAWRELIHPADRERVVAALPRQRTGEFDEKYRILRPDGAVRWLRTRAFPIRDGGGRVYRIAGLSEDVTGRKRLEAQYLHAQRLEAVGRLASGVAHDFNNLLTVILSSSSLLLGDLPPDAPSRQDAEQILGAARKAGDLTRQLLAFSRPQASGSRTTARQVVRPQVLDLNEVVARLEKMLRRLIGEDIGMVTALAGDLGSVEADPGQIEQAIMNLAVNARDAMPHGGRLEVETANVTLAETYARLHLDAPVPGQRTGVEPGAYVMLSVSDTGVGMDEETLAHAFEPFFTTKEPGRGTGLGLATVYGIVTQAGGHIQVESEPGRGTKFEIYLPRVEKEAEAPVERVPAAKELAGTETILLVEDEEEVRALASRALRGGGYTVLEAGDGLEALQLCQDYPAPIHLLLTDVVMPGLGGGQLAERLAALKPEVKILYTSGYAAKTVNRHVNRQSAAFLPKPFTPHDLLRKVREVLDAP